MTKSGSCIKLVMALLLAVFVLFPAFSGSGLAQQGTTKPQSFVPPGQITDQKVNDSDIWREIRKGNVGTVAGPDKAAGMLIQSNGENWRVWRNSVLKTLSAIAILGMIALLALFFALRGRIRIEGGKSGHTIERFTLIERSGHWLLAGSFILLALTGLNITFGRSVLLPVLGPNIFATITLFGKYVHNFVAFAFMTGLVMVTVMWIARNLPTRADLIWFMKLGGIFGGHPPAHKFNGGQKIIFWLVVVSGLSLSLSGWALLDPFSTDMFSSTFSLINSIFGTDYQTALSPIQEQQYQSIWHASVAVFMIVVIIAHIYIGTIGMEGALDAMTSGQVDTNWAKEHHSLWYEEVEGEEASIAGNAPAQPAE